MDAQDWLDSYRRRIREIGQRARRVQETLTAVTATATSGDGAVTVTVAPSGAVQELVLGERAEALSRPQLAETIMTTIGRAHADAARQATRVVAPLVGERSPAMAFLRSQLPVPQDGERR